MGLYRFTSGPSSDHSSEQDAPPAVTAGGVSAARIREATALPNDY
jgi:hypothetical protein